MDLPKDEQVFTVDPLYDLEGLVVTQLAKLEPDTWKVRKTTPFISQVHKLGSNDILVDRVNKVLYCSESIYDRLTQLKI